MKRVFGLLCIVCAGVLPSAMALADTSTTVLTSFPGTTVTDGCAGTVLLPATPLAGPECQEPPPVWIGTGAHSESAGDDGSTSVSAAASGGTPVLGETAYASTARQVVHELDGEARSIEVDVRFDLGTLSSSAPPLQGISPAISQVQWQVFATAPDCTGGATPHSDDEALVQGSVNGSPAPDAGPYGYRTVLTCPDGSNLQSFVSVQGIMFAYAFSYLDEETSASGSADISSITFAVDYV